MKKLRILGRILRRTGTYHILLVFMLVFFLAAVVLWMCESGIGRLVPGIVVTYYIELLKIREKESMDVFLEQLCRLPKLSEAELEEIARWAKRFKK